MLEESIEAALHKQGMALRAACLGIPSVQILPHTSGSMLCTHLASVLDVSLLDKAWKSSEGCTLGPAHTLAPICFRLQWYDLYGVLVHLGHSVHSGHYYCFVRAGNGMWHKCDDTSVRGRERFKARVESAQLKR